MKQGRALRLPQSQHRPGDLGTEDNVGLSLSAQGALLESKKGDPGRSPSRGSECHLWSRGPYLNPTVTQGRDICHTPHSAHKKKNNPGMFFYSRSHTCDYTW